MHPPSSVPPPGGPAPYPYPAGTPPPAYGPPPNQGLSTGTIVAIVVVVVVLAVIVPVILLGVLFWSAPIDSNAQHDGEIVTAFGLRTEKASDTDWLVGITGGSQVSADITLVVINPSTGASTYSKSVSSLLPASNDPDAAFNDNNKNNRLDAGDSLLLKGAGGHILAGYKVQLLKGGMIVGIVNELP